MWALLRCSGGLTEELWLIFLLPEDPGFILPELDPTPCVREFKLLEIYMLREGRFMLPADMRF